jgi:type IX secretion system PorP/SprF family membrane protein
MKKCSKILFSLVFFGLITAELTAQPRFNNEQVLNYRGNEMLINPASTGGIEQFDLSFGLRKQWLSMGSASPLSEALQFQMPLAQHGGLGAWVYNESYGPQNNLQFGAGYAYKIKMGENTLALGLNASGLVMSEKLVSGVDPGDNILAEKMPTQFGFNAGFGAYFFGEKYYAGFSIPQLMTNDIKENKLSNSVKFDRMQFYLTGGYRFDVSEKLSLLPSALLQFSGATSFGYEFMLAAFYLKRFEVAAGYAAHSDLQFALGGFITKNLSIRYQFSQNIGSDYKHIGSSHFFTLRYAWGGGKKTEAPANTGE